MPFEELFVARVADARERLAAELAAAGIDSGLLAPAAWRDLERGLAHRFAYLAGQALLADFDHHRGGPPSALWVRLAEAGARRETGRYQTFISEMLADGPDRFASRWPVLERLLAAAAGFWARNSAEMLVRLREDGPASGGVVARIRPGLSDPHDGGRTVHALAFVDGRELIYKPRGLGLEVGFARLLAWCGERGLSLDLRSPRVIDHGTHGWAELISPAPCDGEAAARRFHRRAGMLLGLLHAFGSRDCHCENLIARGEHPILVDLEAWLPVRLRKWLPGEGLGEAWYRAALQLERSVLATGLLPQWQEGPRRGYLRNVGGLGGGQPGRRLRKIWRNVNTDAMVLGWSEVEEGAGANVPVLDGGPLPPSVYLEEIVSGFAEMYELLLRHRQDLLSPAGPLGETTGWQARLILRSTASYRRLLERSLSPACCRDAEARDAELEALARVFSEPEERPAAWPLLAAERRALEDGDLPLFRVPVDSTRIELPPGVVEGALTASSLEAARESLQGLSPADLQAQTGLIRASLAPAVPPAGGMDAEGLEAAALPDRGRLLEAALSIGERLRARAIAGPDGSLAWIGPRSFNSREIYQLTVLGPDLYGGTAGIALFLAALGRATGEAAWGELALRAVAPLRQCLSEPDAGRLRLGIGGLTGLPSVLYAFLWMGELLGEPDLAAEARARASLLTPAGIAADGELDVISGAAGAILALLALVPSIPPADGAPFLDLAGLCAGHLLAHRAPGKGPRGWAARGRPPLAGFSHGAAGICHALLRLYARTGSSELLEAAREGISGERLLYSTERGDWLDPRHPGAPPRSTWCHGAPGIALARIGALDVLDDAGIREEIGAALEITRSHPLTTIDHLCCGNLGRAEILLYASRALGDSGLREEALSLAGRVLRRAGGSGGFGCAPRAGSDLTDPSFFRGEAGIGFTLLRLADPGSLPCPLLLEGPRTRVL